jgi:competence protein ComEC
MLSLKNLITKVPLLLPLVFIITTAIGFLAINLPDRNFSLCFLNVGQGDSTLIRTPGGRTILIDGGPDNSVLRELSRILPFWEKKIDIAIVTHLHADHITGLIAAIKRYQINKFVLNGFSYQSPTTQALEQILIEKTIPVSGLVLGEALTLGELTLTALWPINPPTTITNELNPNDSAIVLLGKYHKFEFLLTSDREFNPYPAKFPAQLLIDVDVLKVPHQGNKTGTSEALIRQTRPEFAIIPVGKNNYGHPAPDTVKLFTRQGIPVYRTDHQGTTCFIVPSNKDEINVVFKL